MNTTIVICGQIWIPDFPLKPVSKVAFVLEKHYKNIRNSHQLTRFPNMQLTRMAKFSKIFAKLKFPKYGISILCVSIFLHIINNYITNFAKHPFDNFCKKRSILRVLLNRGTFAVRNSALLHKIYDFCIIDWQMI